MAKYRVAVIGHTGRGNYGHGLDTVWKSIPDCALVGVADANADGLAEAVKRLGVQRGYDDYRRMLDEVKPDVASIAPRWLDQHRDMVVACAERGIHVYCEKPFCRTVEEADEIVAACTASNVKLAIAFQTRYSPKLPVIRRLIDDGAIGRILEMRGRGKEDHRGGGEDLWVLGSHIMNLMHYFAGSAQWCFATIHHAGRLAERRDIVDGNEGIGPLLGDVVNATYGFDDNVTGFFGSHRRAGPGGTGRFGLELVGTEGKIQLLTGTLPGAFILQDALWSPARSNARWVSVSSAGVGRPESLRDGGLHAGNQLACLDLLDAIESDRQPEANVFEARTTVEMISAVFVSHFRSAPVKIPLEERRGWWVER